MKNLAIIPFDTFDIELNSLKALESNEDYIHTVIDSRFFESNHLPGEISLCDLDTSEIILQNVDQNEINILLKNKELEMLKIASLTPDLYLPKEIDSIEYLVLHGYAINNCANDISHQLYPLASKVKNYLPHFFFIENLEERFAIEKQVNLYYKEILEYEIDFITNNLIDFIKDKKVKALELGWFPLSKNDYAKIATLGIEVLNLSYTYNPEIKVLPKSVSELSVIGNTVNSLQEIDLNGLTLENLTLDGNSIKDSLVLEDFNTNLDALSLRNNLITRVDFSNSGKSLSFLDLSQNQITNTGLIIPEACNHLEYLDLSYNQLNVNLDFLFKIDRYFPNLDYINLAGNKFMDAFGQSALASGDNENQIQAIKDYLNLIEYFQDISFDDIKDEINRYNNKYFTKIEWNIKNSSTELLVKEIQYHLENYLKFLKEDEFLFFAEGSYINLYNKNISILLTSSEQTLSLEIFSSEQTIIKDYFYKYLQLVYEIIYNVTHLTILPTFNASSNLLDLYDFFRKVYRIDTKLKQKKSAGYLVELDVKTNRYTLLVNELKDYIDTRVDIDKVMFIVVSSKSAIVYTLNDDDTISNYVLDKNNRRLNSLVIRTAEDKEKYKKTLLNPYLLDKPFKEIDAFVDGEVKKRFNVIINPIYVYENSEQPGFLYLNKDTYKTDINNRNTEHTSVVKINGNELLFISK